MSSTPSMLQSRRSLYVGGLEETVTISTLRAAMIPYGPIKSIEMPMDYKNNTHKGFGFVEYEDPDDASEAIFNMDGAELMGKTLSVSLAQPNQVKLGSHKAVWSTDEWFQEQTGMQGEQQKEQQKAANEDASALKEDAPLP